LSTPDLAVEHLIKFFAGHSAVDDLSFSVERGSFFSILGPSGCGKTTLLRMIAGFTVPDGGGILIGGRSMQGVGPNRRPVNMIFQQLALFPMMTVGENVAFGLARRGMDKAQRRRRSEAMLERVGLAGASHKRVDELSGGQRQRVAIAASIVLEPELLVADEPVSMLDVSIRAGILKLLDGLRARGLGILMITHDLSTAARFAFLLATALLLPEEAVVDALSPRFNTVQGFHTDFVRGLRLIRLALDILAKKAVPPAVFIKHRLITPENVDHFYPNDSLL